MMATQVELFTQIFYDWRAINILALLVTFFFTTVVYMLSLGLNLPNVKRWAKAEYAQVLAGFLLVFSIIGILTIGWEVSKDVAGNTFYIITSGSDHPINPGPASPFDIGKAYLGTVLKCERAAYRAIYLIMSFAKPFESIGMDAAGSEAVGVAGGAVSVFVSLGSYVANRITWIAIFHYLLWHMFDLFEATMLTMFLPAGLILRSFPISRGLGGLLIAIAIGCYFIFPMSFIAAVAMQGDTSAYCTAIPADEVISAETVCPDDMTSFFIHGQEFIRNVPKFTSLVTAMGQNIAALYMQAMFYTLVALIITFTFIRSTASLFAADLQELGRGLLKLI